MPQGCGEDCAIGAEARVTFVVGMPRVFSLSTQKSDAPLGIDCRMARGLVRSPPAEYAFIERETS